MKKSVHIIYLVEDGVSSLTCGVGTIANNFLSAFKKIADFFSKNNILLRLSVISLKYQKSDIGFRSDFLNFTKELCRKYNGSLILTTKPASHSSNYFTFSDWEDLNTEIRVLLQKNYDFRDTVTIVIANDTIFADSYLLEQKVVNIWLPNSLSILHRQSYVDQTQRLAWEMRAVKRAKRIPSCFIGSVSNYISGIIQDRFNLDSEKIIPLFNGFYFPKLKSYLRDKKEIIAYLSSRGIPLNRDIVFCFGRADEYKGLDRSLLAMLKISKKYDLLPVLIASKFSNEKFIQSTQDKLRKIADQSQIKLVLFFGYEFEMPKYFLQYSRVKFLLNMPTRDFCPLSPYEAEILGHKDLCIVNSDIDCFKSAIIDMENGFLCRPIPSVIAGKIDKISALSVRKRKAIIKAGKARSFRQMDISLSYQQSLELVINSYL